MVGRLLVGRFLLRPRPVGFKLNILESLASQARYAPRGKRLSQMAAAEDFLLEVDPDRGYPVGLVVHAITGYRPKHEDAAAGVNPAELLTGLALQHDLGLFIEQVSADADLAALDPELGGEPILGIDDVCRRFGVTSKTIQRWRRRGLPARRFLFDDPAGGRAKKRVGFRLSCVERFVAKQDGAAVRPAGTSPLSECEQAALVAHARRLVDAGQDRRETVRRVALRAGRSALAVLHTLEQHDRLHADAAEDQILTRAADAPDAKRSAQLREAIDAGLGLFATARRLTVRTATAYRAVLEAKAERLASAAVKFHDDPLYHADDPADAERQVEQLLASAESAIGQGTGDVAELRAPKGLPAYFASLYRTPLLTPSLERGLFLALNYHRFRFAELRQALDPHLCRRRDLQRLERHLTRSRTLKNRIVTANLRLVVSVARKHCRPGLDLMELVSDGNVVLMRAVDGFDVHRGFKFSTYATLALMKGYARSVPAMQAETATPRLSSEPSTADRGLHRVSELDELDQLLGRLSRLERRAISEAWGLQPGTERELSKASRQAGERALQKLRAAVEA